MSLVIDVGCGALIANGKVEIKQGVEIDHLKSNAVGFNDGTSIEVDDIILAYVILLRIIQPVE